MNRLFVALLALFITSFGFPEVVGAAQVKASLVAADSSIQPGRVFTVVLRLQHDSHWHTYWLNPGTGYPTSLTWKLPEGFTAGEISWPTPNVIRDATGNITGYGFENEALLLVKITAPADLPVGHEVKLSATAAWLMCNDVCIPGESEVSLTLPVKAETPTAGANAGMIDQAMQALPRPLQDWEASFSQSGTTVILRLHPTKPGAHRPADLHFFDTDAVLDYTAPQKVTETKDGLELAMTRAADAKDLTKLVGVLASANGWGGAAGYQGALIEAVLAKPGPMLGGTPKTGSTQSFGAVLFLAFLGGLVLNLMPCVFPVLGIKVLGFVNQSADAPARVAAHGLAFTSGVLLSFWTLAGALLALRAGGERLGWGFQLQSPAFMFGLAVFLLIFALNLSGVFEVGFGVMGAGASLQGKQGYAGSFFTGALATVVATPCSAPFLAPALGAALTLSPAASVAVFTAIGLGLSLPYLLLSVFPSTVRLLPRPGAWMETFKQAMAFPLYATVVWLLWVLAAQTANDDYALLWIGFGLVLAAMAAWVYGRFAQAYGPAGWRVFGRIAAIVFLAGGIAAGWPRASHDKVAWQKWSPEAVASAQAAGRYVYVDFTARWCATCQSNKAAVFSSPDVRRRFQEKNVLLLKADWTNRDPAITGELEKWQRSAVPFNLIYAPRKSAPIMLPELLTPGKVLAAIEQIDGA